MNPDYSVEMIVKRMKEAVASRSAVELSAESIYENHADSDSERFSNDAEFDIQPITLEPSFQPRSEDHYHVDDLLKYNDGHFLINAYRAILKRPPDESGYNGFIEALRSGELNKIDVLGRLRFSKEGRACNVQIDGLSIAASVRKLYRLPIIGYFMNLIVAIARLPVSIRNQRQFESHALVQQEMLASHINHIGSLLNDADLFSSLKDQIGRLEKLAREQAATNDVFLDRMAHLTSYFEERLNEEASERQSEANILRGYYDEELSTARERAQSLSEDLTGVKETVRGFYERLTTLQEKDQQFTAELILQGHRLTRVLEEPLASGGSVAGKSERETHHPHLLDAFYASFDEQFRGRSEDIKQRLNVYLPFLANLPLTAQILDVGCGRGEWLELLKENGRRAIGVDANSVLVDQCRARGLQTVQSDLISYLNKLSDDSLDAISGFHIVEHLPLESLVMFLNEALRVLKPGGVIILETPNPRNVLVGSCNFYFDPTHQNPIPSEVLKFLVDSRGFARTNVLPLNPSDEKPVEGDSDLVVRFNRLFYGPMDYGLIGWKPEPGNYEQEVN